ncbi:preprotein translocase subunit SecE [Mesomycoplasma flocculare]|uniref:preprotein translocase subunit SecE n=1 Tax=Mesomycoplasma flocculare TaxID=2128 RepID=UPI00280A9FA6|nr:preprotein translocase subunit SecE [Mesomycoplasma flocculare]
MSQTYFASRGKIVKGKNKKEPKITKEKKKREKKHFFRLFVKEMKRVKWPSAHVSFKSFGQSLIFSLIFMVVFLGVTVIAAIIWNQVGVGI